jgi:uncharacterized repeat protein (TIGR03943 family)
MTSLFTRWIPSLTLGIWSAVLLATYFTGRVASLLHPSFRPGVLWAGFGLAALSLLFASRPTPAECCADETCTHPLSRTQTGRWTTFLVMVLPVTVAAWMSPEQFSRQAFQQRAEVTDAAALGQRPAKTRLPPPAEPARSEPTLPATSSPPETQTAVASVTPVPPPPAGSAPTNAAQPATIPATGTPAPGNEAIPDYLQKTAEGYIVAEVLDLLYAVQDSQLRKDFEGRTVQLIAQMMPGTEKGAAPADPSAPTRFKAVRMFMTCCAADARPVSTLVESKTLPELPEMTWVKIVGKATFPLENGKRVGVLQATSVEQTKPPEESMLF